MRTRRRINLPVLRIAWFLGLTVLACLPGCGPTSSDNAMNLEPRASAAEPPELQPTSQATPSTQYDQVSTATRPVSFASENDASFVSEKMRIPGGDSSKPAHLAETLVLPDWIAQELNSAKVSVRLRALDRWAQQGSEASLGPLVVALDNEDNDVRAKAMAIIEQHWAVAQEAEQ